MSDEFDWIHRDRGILTKRDREILVGESGEELSKNALNQRAYNIRKRIQQAIYDFQLIAQQLRTTDIRQIFEPAYEWSRERRRLDDQGLTSKNPEITPLLWGWLGLFEFFSYGMYAGGKPETQILMKALIQDGIERGFRQYQHDKSQTYEEIDASLSLQYGNPVLQNNHLRSIRNDLPKEPNKVAEQVMRLHRERKIPQNIASHWINEFVHHPGQDSNRR